MTLFIVSQDRETVDQVMATLLEIDGVKGPQALGSADALRLRLSDDSEGHVVLMDSRLDDGTGLELAREISSTWPLVAVLLLSPSRGAEVLAAALEAGVRDVLPLPTSLETYSRKLLATMTWARSVHHRVEGSTVEKQRQIGHVVAVVGAKGGVGASVLSLLLARELAQTAPTCVVDLDLRNGDLAAYCGVRTRRSIVDLVDAGEDIGGRELGETTYPVRRGVSLLSAPAEGESGEMLDESHIRRIVQALRYQYACVVLDCGSRLDDIQATGLDFADEILVVATPDVPALRSARRLCETMERLDIARSTPTALVLNRASRKAEIQAAAAARLAGMTMAVEVPDSTTALEGPMNTATILDGAPAGMTRVLSDLSRRLWAPQHGALGAAAQVHGSRVRRRSRIHAASERGQVVAEMPVVFFLATLVLLVCLQMVLWGASHLVAVNAAQDAARYYAVGMPQSEVVQKVRDDVPWGWANGVSIGTSGGGQVTATVDVPSPIDLPRTTATADILWEE